MTEIYAPLPALDSDEIRLLTAVTEAFLPGVASPTECPQLWPVWDFVAATWEFPASTDRAPEDVLVGLPAAVSLYPDQRRYRLYWTSEIRHDGMPADRDLFGLTIAGMHAIRESKPQWGRLADEFAGYIGDLSRTQMALQRKPDEVAERRSPLPGFGHTARHHGEPLPLALSDDAAAHVLRHESVMLAVNKQQAGWESTVTGRSLRPFREVRTAADYLAIVWREHSSTPEDAPRSALTLPHALDYFAYVLEFNTAWPTQFGHPIRPHGFRTAASIAQPVRTSEEFQDRISALCTVVDQFLPNTPEDIRRSTFGPGDGSLNRLQYYLLQQVDGELEMASIKDAVRVLRDVRDLRVEQQHDGRGNRQKAAQARAHLRLPVMTQSWEGEWNSVTAQAANAVLRIISALQTNERGG